MNWDNINEILSASVYQAPEADMGKAWEQAKVAFRKSIYTVPGAVLCVGVKGRIVFHKAFGVASVMPNVAPMRENMVFDIGDLTKPLVTSILAMKLVERGLLLLDSKVSRIIQTFGTYGKDRMTVRHLLNHTSGCPVTLPYYRQLLKTNPTIQSALHDISDAIYREIHNGRLDNLPGKTQKYSDIGYIFLGYIMKLITGASFDKLVQREISSALGLQSTGFIDLQKLKREGMEVVSDIIVPTAECQWRKRLICGEVFEENAWAMGGVAGHNGIFSTAHEIHEIACELIRCWHGEGNLVNKEVLRTFWTKDDLLAENRWVLGWETANQECFSAQAVGHNSFTGCSLWIEPEKEVDIVLLTNRIHPFANADDSILEELRGKLYKLVLEKL